MPRKKRSKRRGLSTAGAFRVVNPGAAPRNYAQRLSRRFIEQMNYWRLRRLAR